MTDSLDYDYKFEELDTSWLRDFEAMEKDYKSYYTEDLLFIRVNYIYVNSKQDITNIYEEKHLFKKPNILLKRNSIVNKTKYSLLSILKYNINIEPYNLKTFFRSKNNNIGNQFLQSIKNINDVVFDKSISMFHDLNSLIIILLEKEQSNNINSNTNNFTKRVYINKMKIKNNEYKKTRRNLFKDNI